MAGKGGHTYRITAEEVEKAIGLRRAGESWPEVAFKLGRDDTSLRRRVGEAYPEEEAVKVQSGAWGDLFDDPEDYLKLLSAETRQRAKL